MNLALVAIVLAICAGGVIAVSTRDSGVAAIGLAIALVGAAAVVDPLPSAAILGVRVVAALLVASILRSALRGGPRLPSPLGWPAEALLATGGAIAGLGLAVGLASLGVPVGPPGGEPGPAPGGAVPDGAAVMSAMALTVAAAAALLTMGVAALVRDQPGPRQAIGLVLTTQGILLLRIGIAGPPGELEEIARAALLVVSAATGAVLASAAARIGGAGPDDDGEARPAAPRRAAAAR